MDFSSKLEHWMEKHIQTLYYLSLIGIIRVRLQMSSKIIVQYLSKFERVKYKKRLKIWIFNVQVY